MSDINEQSVEETASELHINGEEVAPGISQDEHAQIRQKALEEAKNVRHAWVQKGNQLICRSCVHQHASFIYGKRLIGIDDNGMPILVNRTP